MLLLQRGGGGIGGRQGQEGGARWLRNSTEEHVTLEQGISILPAPPAPRQGPSVLLGVIFLGWVGVHTITSSDVEHWLSNSCRLKLENSDRVNKSSLRQEVSLDSAPGAQNKAQRHLCHPVTATERVMWRNWWQAAPLGAAARDVTSLGCFHQNQSATADSAARGWD